MNIFSSTHSQLYFCPTRYIMGCARTLTNLQAVIFMTLIVVAVALLLAWAWTGCASRAQGALMLLPDELPPDCKGTCGEGGGDRD